MAEERTQRRLAAILAADVVGFSRMMEADEAGTMTTLKSRRRDVLDPLVAKHQGRIFKTTGDGVLVEFASAVNAVQCAVDLQQAMAAANDGVPDERNIVLRIGVNLGDVMVEGSDLYGDGVNIAARLESLADPGGILVSGTAFDHIKNNIKVGFEDIGAQDLKNIAAPVRAYRSIGTAWAIPAFLLYGTIYAGPADSRWHETGHGTPFRSRWMNDALYQIASFQVMRRPTIWRWSHARHHTDTLITGRDPEIQVHRPVSLPLVLLDFFGLKLAPSEFLKLFVNAAGRMLETKKTFVPETEWPKAIMEARVWLAVFAAVAGACLYLGSWLPALFVGLPSVYGGWLYNFFGLTQHAALPENVLDYRLNSRTVLMNPVFRFLYWNMNYHVEHHMYPLVPYHALPRLHEAIKTDCPPAYSSTWAAYRELIPAIQRQLRDPAYVVRRPLPA